MNKILMSLIFLSGCQTYQPTLNTEYGPNLPVFNYLIVLDNPVEESRLITITSVTPVYDVIEPPLDNYKHLPATLPRNKND